MRCRKSSFINKPQLGEPFMKLSPNKMLLLVALLSSNVMASSFNCGFKPLPPLGYEVGRCVDGEWEMVSKQTASGMNCGLKPLPPLGHEIGRCINGQWEIVSTQPAAMMNCGLKPMPPLGYEVGRCVNGEWELVGR